MLIADITGYTSYLSGTEIDHAQNVLEDLLETVVAKLAPPFAVLKGEGDAVFLFAPAGTVSGAVLLDALDSCYFGFRRRLRDVSQATSCECNACVLIPRLDLKFVIHAGQAIRQSTFGSGDLMGSDVVLLHRLLKNHVVEEHGWRGYALVTEAAVTQVGLDCLRLGMVAHREVYDDAGPVVGFVEDLDARWRAEDARASFRVQPDDALWRFEIDLPAAPHVSWEWLTSPRLRPRWASHIVRVDQENVAGRAGVGTTNHCVHGHDAVLEEVLDWQPFDTTTTRSITPVGALLTTYDLARTDGGCHLIVLCSTDDPEAAGPIWPMVVPVLDERFGVALTNLAGILALEAGSDGRTVGEVERHAAP
ncbi:MAG: hypothetical protein QOH61_2236 [Chloroflexota bacterium]|jgi:hypothetical protein|nr:hypothetical protein [Chloroflexota bacterium]